jgi:hypothetical protein
MAVGLTGTLAVTRSLAALLFGVDAADPKELYRSIGSPTRHWTPGYILPTAVTNVDPIVALREESSYLQESWHCADMSMPNIVM